MWTSLTVLDKVYLLFEKCRHFIGVCQVYCSVEEWLPDFAHRYPLPDIPVFFTVKQCASVYVAAPPFCGLYGRVADCFAIITLLDPGLYDSHCCTACRADYSVTLLFLMKHPEWVYVQDQLQKFD